MIVAGLMTGTSLDGIDVAVCDINQQGDRQSIALLHFSTSSYPADVVYLVRRALQHKATLEELSDLPFMLADAYAAAIQAVPQEVRSRIELIGAHGQTLWHNPPASTWQSLNGSALATKTNTPVVYDFRSADVAVGGQGAPLVPIFDDLVLRSSSADRVAVNIGGMANITLLPSSGSLNELVAFDTGPGNVLINAVCERSFGKRFDDKGAFAAAGRIIPAALEELKVHPFFSQAPPKSTGREIFNEQLVNGLATGYLHPGSPAEDLIATLTELTAWSITDHVQRYQPTTQELIVSGGGVHNEFLMHRIKQMMPRVNVLSSSDVGIDADAKEAMCFAAIAYRTLNHLPSNVPSVTGASQSVVLGAIATPHR